MTTDQKDEREGGLVKASVIKSNEKYAMWYAFRNAQGYRGSSEDGYKIGYAESDDGLQWERKDHERGLIASRVGWDFEMVAYPHVIVDQDQLFMFYNGNGFGKSGFGLATRQL